MGQKLNIEITGVDPFTAAVMRQQMEAALECRPSAVTPCATELRVGYGEEAVAAMRKAYAARYPGNPAY